MLENTVAFNYTPYIHFESYKNVLKTVREHQPNSDVFIYLDSIRTDIQQYSDVASSNNCNLIVRQDTMSYIRRDESTEVNEPKITEWLMRIKHTCENTDATWVLLLEDDVILKRAIEHWPTADCGKNMDQIGFLGGGSIFRRKVFLDCLEKSDVPAIIKDNHTASWAGDHLLSHIFIPHGATEEKWIELAEPNYYDRGPHAVYHGYKDLHNK